MNPLALAFLAYAVTRDKRPSGAGRTVTLIPGREYFLRLKIAAAKRYPLSAADRERLLQVLKDLFHARDIVLEPNGIRMIFTPQAKEEVPIGRPIMVFAGATVVVVDLYPLGEPGV